MKILVLHRHPEGHLPPHRVVRHMIAAALGLAIGQ
jgi:hypothetical protein